MKGEKMMEFVNKIVKSVKPFIKGAALWIDKESPTIFVLAGTLGMGVAVVDAIRLAPKVEAEVQKVREDETKDRLDVIKTYAKGYWRPALIYSVSAFSTLHGNHINLSRLATLGTAYALSEKKAKDIMNAVEREVGGAKAEDVENNRYAEYARGCDLDGVISTGMGDTYFLEPITGRLFKASTNAIDHAVNEVNRIINCRDKAAFGEFEYALGFSESDIGKSLEWTDHVAIRYVPEKKTKKDGEVISILIIKYDEPPRLSEKFILNGIS